jgi:hypothetical protein
VASHWYAPGRLGVNGSDVYVPFPLTCLTLVNAGGPAHRRSAGPKSLYVIVPVGPDGPPPPERVAVSLIVPVGDSNPA